MSGKIFMASYRDKAEILSLYRSHIGREYCPWNEHYPTIDNIEEDLSLDSLFIMRDGNGRLAAAISIDHDENVDRLECWSRELQPSGELARIAVDVGYQGRGIAREMIGYATEVLRQRGCRSVHMLVNRNNIKALRSYDKLGFDIVGECFMYEQPFLCYEKKIDQEVNMDFLELAKSRYSVRKFDDREIEQEKLDLILEAGNVAPTGCNYQPQRIYVVRSEEKLAKLNELSRCIFGAKTVLLFTYDSGEDWKNPLEKGVHCGVQDVSIVASHIMLEAWELGIGTCWVNYFANSRLEKEMGLPESERAVLLMPMGYPAADSVPLEKMHSVYKVISETVRYI